MMDDLIFVSLEDWDEIWWRNQFLCAGLASSCPGYSRGRRQPSA